MTIFQQQLIIIIRHGESIDIQNQGLILNVFHFEQCVAFYKQVFRLPEMFSKVNGDFKLTCLAFGDSYLIIETAGVASQKEKTVFQSATILRFNVACIEETLTHISTFDSDAKVITNDWGSIIRIAGPDGNPTSIRDNAGFKHQQQTGVV